MLNKNYFLNFLKNDENVEKYNFENFLFLRINFKKKNGYLIFLKKNK